MPKQDSMINTNNTSDESEYLIGLMKMIADCWEPCEIQSLLNMPYPAVSFDLHRDGSVTNAVISRTSGIMASDLSCLDAVLAARPEAPNELCRGTSNITCDFFLLKYDSTGTWAATGQRGNGTKLESTNDCAARTAIRPYRHNEPAFVFHIIPAGALSAPWFTPEEIHHESNFGALKLSCAEHMIRKIRYKLTAFEAANRPCNRASLLDFRKSIFDDYKPVFDEAIGGYRVACGTSICMKPQRLT